MLSSGLRFVGYFVGVEEADALSLSLGVTDGVGRRVRLRCFLEFKLGDRGQKLERSVSRGGIRRHVCRALLLLSGVPPALCSVIKMECMIIFDHGRNVRFLTYL